MLSIWGDEVQTDLAVDNNEVTSHHAICRQQVLKTERNALPKVRKTY